jgi:hypothetical protein
VRESGRLSEVREACSARHGNAILGKCGSRISAEKSSVLAHVAEAMAVMPGAAQLSRPQSMD